jgi:signal transduction histidine kinase
VSHVNGELIYRAIENVIRNAIKYSEPGGKVVIRTAILAGGKALQIRVEDTGPGLPDSQMGAIFRPFVRAESTGDARAGVGLGLAITRQAIELHGGSVRAHKAQPRGLIVEIVVPLTSDRPQRYRFGKMLHPGLTGWSTLSGQSRRSLYLPLVLAGC